MRVALRLASSASRSSRALLRCRATTRLSETARPPTRCSLWRFGLAVAPGVSSLWPQSGAARGGNRPLHHVGFRVLPCPFTGCRRCLKLVANSDLSDPLPPEALGPVYLAKEEHSDGFSRVVAVKLLNAQWTDCEEIGGRIRDEARLLGLLRHPEHRRRL